MASQLELIDGGKPQDTTVITPTVTSGPPSPAPAVVDRPGPGPAVPATPRPAVPLPGRSCPRRIACIDVPTLPLQLLIERHPEWADLPVAVVDEDRPQGTILWVNERARQANVLPGLRYAAGLSMCPRLCAGEVPREEIERGVGRITEILWRFSPVVEPSKGEPGVFWLDAAGLDRLEPSLARWARGIRSGLLDLGFTSRIAVGFTRFGAYAVARTVRHLAVLRDRGQEERSTRTARLDRLGLEPKARAPLAKLGIHTVGAFLELPRDGLAKRFGTTTLEFHRLATGDVEPPFDPLPPPQPIEVWAQLEHPESGAHRLLFLVKRLLHPLLLETADRGHALAELFLDLLLDDGKEVSASVRPAKPILDAMLILDLVRLKLEATELPAGATEITLSVRSAPASVEQVELFRRSRRDLAAANRSFARIRAEFGGGTVVRAHLHDRHLPEASFTWEPLEEARLPQPRKVEPERRPLIRRIFKRPTALPCRERHEPDGWLISGFQRGPAIRLRGPYVVSGGWWVREVHREYHFVETERGDLLWVYYDRRRRQWFLHGQVE